MFPFLSFVISLAGLTYASYTDFKSRTIPDWVSHGMLLAGLSLAAYESYSTQSITPLFWSAALTIAVFILAYIFWRAGAWAGGDVKLFTGLAALNPFNPFIVGEFLNLSFSWGGRELLIVSALPFFMLNLFIVSVFALMPYSALLAFSCLRNPSLRQEFFSLSSSAISRAVEWALVISAFTFVLHYFSLPVWGLFPLLLLAGFLHRAFRVVVGIFSFVLLFLSLISHSDVFSLFLVLVSINFIFSWYGFAQRHVLTIKKKISDLQDGDIPGEWIGVERGKLTRRLPVSFQTIIKAGVERDLETIMRFLRPQGDAWADPRQAAGVYPEDIARLQAAVKKGELENTILVKASAPFAPAVLIAYLLLTILGDGPLAWWFG